MVNFNQMYEDYTVKWQSGLLNSKENVLPVYDKPYHKNKRNTTEMGGAWKITELWIINRCQILIDTNKQLSIKPTLLCYEVITTRTYRSAGRSSCTVWRWCYGRSRGHCSRSWCPRPGWQPRTRAEPAAARRCLKCNRNTHVLSRVCGDVWRV